MKHASTSKVQDQIDRPLPRESHALPASDDSRQEVLVPSPRKALPSLPRTVDYITGRQRAPTPACEPSELLIEGGPGSLMVDLRGIGMALHPAAFAFRMPDDSMAGEQIRCGDIAIIEPCRSELREGDVVMLALDGKATLRRVTYKGEIAYFRGGQRAEPLLLPAWEYAFSGVVAAVLRTFSRRGLPARAQEPDKPKKPRKSKQRHACCEPRLRDDPPEARQLKWRTF